MRATRARWVGVGSNALRNTKDTANLRLDVSYVALSRGVRGIAAAPDGQCERAVASGMVQAGGCRKAVANEGPNARERCQGRGSYGEGTATRVSPWPRRVRNLGVKLSVTVTQWHSNRYGSFASSNAVRDDRHQRKQMACRAASCLSNQGPHLSRARLPQGQGIEGVEIQPSLLR